MIIPVFSETSQNNKSRNISRFQFVLWKKRNRDKKFHFSHSNCFLSRTTPCPKIRVNWLGYDNYEFQHQLPTRKFTDSRTQLPFVRNCSQRLDATNWFINRKFIWIFCLFDSLGIIFQWDFPFLGKLSFYCRKFFDWRKKWM